MKNDAVKPPIFFEGEKHDIHLPSGKVVTIRESNGEDDAILSKVKDVLDNNHIFNFLSGIVIKDHDLQTKPTAENVMDWLTGDRNYLLYKQRLINLDNELHFSHQCPSCKQKNNYTEDLSEFDGDLSQKDYSPKGVQVKKYPEGSKKSLEFLSSKGFKFKFDLMTGRLDRKDSAMPDTQKHVNSLLLARNIQLEDNGKFINLFTFKQFPSRDLVELRKFVITNDDPFNPLVNFKCENCEHPGMEALFNMTSFFFPGQM